MSPKSSASVGVGSDLYDRRLSVLATQPLTTAIATAAHASMQSVNAYVRGACLDRLRRDGLCRSRAVARLRDVCCSTLR